MTEFDAVVTKHGAIATDESPSLLRAWWMNWNLRYDIAMSTIILSLNVAAIVYMCAHKIPFTTSSPFYLLLVGSIGLYFSTGISSIITWFKAIEDVSMSEFYFWGRISHTGGFCLFFVLFYYISPHLALCAALPCLLIWFVPVMIAPVCPPIYKGLGIGVKNVRDWWKHVNQPRQATGISYKMYDGIYLIEENINDSL